MGSSVSKQGLTESGVPTGSWVIHLIQAPRTPPVKTFQRFLPANSWKKTNDYICTMKWLLAGGKSTYTHKTVLYYVGACTSPRACWNFMQNLQECMLFYGEGIHNFYQSQKGPRSTTSQGQRINVLNKCSFLSKTTTIYLFSWSNVWWVEMICSPSMAEFSQTWASNYHSIFPFAPLLFQNMDSPIYGP